MGGAAVVVLLGAVPAAPGSLPGHAGTLALPAAPAGVTATSPNWVGYAINSGGYTSVASGWTQPAVDCAAGDGAVVFWVGLDGWGSNAVEQTGTEAICSGGKAAYSAWWETYPTNSITAYADRVAPGDVMSAKVVYQGASGYELYLTDRTQGWTEDTVHPGSAAATNVSAEIVAETPGSGSGLAALPDFDTVTFTGSLINNNTLAAENAIGINLVRNNNTMATTSDLVNGTDFTITWQRNS
jgi:hypothetical protein